MLLFLVLFLFPSSPPLLVRKTSYYTGLGTEMLPAGVIHAVIFVEFLMWRRKTCLKCQAHPCIITFVLIFCSTVSLLKNRGLIHAKQESNTHLYETLQIRRQGLNVRLSVDDLTLERHELLHQRSQCASLYRLRPTKQN